MNTHKTTATLAQSIAEAGAQPLFEQALQTYVHAVTAFEATGNALPLELAERSAAQTAHIGALEDGIYSAYNALLATVDLHVTQQIAAAIADLL